MERSKHRNGIWVLLILLLLISSLVYIGSEKFSIKKITVLGNEKIEYNDIVNISGIQKGENILMVNINEVKSRLQSNPYISVKTIQRKLPDQIVISIKERKPAAAIEYIGSYIIIDNDGIILDIIKSADKNKYPLVNGLKVSSYKVGQRLQTSDPYQLIYLCSALDSLYTQKLDGFIAEINVENPENIYFVSQYGLRIIIGQAVDIPKKIIWIKQILPQLSAKDKTKGILDVSAGTSASYKEN